VSDPGFVHLHVHSSYSLLEGALTIGKLAELAKADRQPALALTDSDNMFGALEFSDKLSGSGIQPIVGCALSVDFGDQEAPRHQGHAPRLPRLVLLAGATRVGVASVKSAKTGRMYWAMVIAGDYERPKTPKSPPAGSPKTSPKESKQANTAKPKSRGAEACRLKILSLCF